MAIPVVLDTDIGFDVDNGPLFQTPEEAARQAKEEAKKAALNEETPQAG